MNRRAVILIVVLVPVALVAVGCHDKCRQQLAGAEQQYIVKHQELQQNLADSEIDKGRLMSQLNDRDAQLSTANAEIASLTAKLAGMPTAPEGWQTTISGAKLTLASDILFAPGRATLSQRGAARLSRVASTIKATYPDAIVRVYGFTDNDPIKKSAKFWKDNLDLSANRAMAVTRQLRKLGIAAENIETISMGATHFVAPNQTAAGKAKNRRVEIVVIKQE